MNIITSNDKQGKQPQQLSLDRALRKNNIYHSNWFFGNVGYLVVCLFFKFYNWLFHLDYITYLQTNIRNFTLTSKKLDNIDYNNVASFLSSNLSIFRRDRRSLWSKEKEQNRNQHNQPQREKGKTIMPFTLGGEQYQVISFNIPNSRKPGVHYIVDSQFAIAVYLVDRDGLDDFEDDQPFALYSGHKNRRYFDEDVNLPYAGRWYLIIWNTNNNPTAVSYEIYV
jgi:hypothetical protein